MSGADRDPQRERTLPALALASAALLVAFSTWPSTDNAAGLRPVLDELPPACELLSAGRAGELLDGTPERATGMRHQANRSTCGWSAGQRSVNLGLFAMSTAAVDYRNLPEGKFAAAVAGVVAAGGFTGKRDVPGAGAFEFAGDDSVATWVNSGIPVGSRSPTGAATKELFVVVTARGFADDASARRAVRDLALATQQSLAAAGK